MPWCCKPPHLLMEQRYEPGWYPDCIVHLMQARVLLPIKQNYCVRDNLLQVLILTVRAEGCKGLSLVSPTWNRCVRRQVCKARLVKRYCLAEHLALHSRQQVSQDSSRMSC